MEQHLWGKERGEKALLFPSFPSPEKLYYEKFNLKNQKNPRIKPKHQSPTQSHISPWFPGAVPFKAHEDSRVIYDPLGLWEVAGTTWSQYVRGSFFKVQMAQLWIMSDTQWRGLWAERGCSWKKSKKSMQNLTKNMLGSCRATPQPCTHTVLLGFHNEIVNKGEGSRMGRKPSTFLKGNFSWEKTVS